VQEVGVLAETVTVPTQHLHEVVAPAVVMLPLLDAVEGGGTMQLAEDELVVLDYTRHVLDSNGSIQRVVTV
jgi:hypothetical protein